MKYSELILKVFIEKKGLPATFPKMSALCIKDKARIEQ